MQLANILAQLLLSLVFSFVPGGPEGTSATVSIVESSGLVGPAQTGTICFTGTTPKVLNAPCDDLPLGENVNIPVVVDRTAPPAGSEQEFGGYKWRVVVGNNDGCHWLQIYDSAGAKWTTNLSVPQLEVASHIHLTNDCEVIASEVALVRFESLSDEFISAAPAEAVDVYAVTATGDHRVFEGQPFVLNGTTYRFAEGQCGFDTCLQQQVEYVHAADSTVHYSWSGFFSIDEYNEAGRLIQSAHTGVPGELDVQLLNGTVIFSVVALN